MSGKLIMKKSVRELCRTGMLCAVALVLSLLENMLPDMPFVLPGMKLGLSNLAVMFSLELCSLPSSLGIVAVKALFAFATRGFSAFLMSFAGGILSVLGMFLLVRSKKPHFGCLGIGVSGAFLHNCGQLAAAHILVSDAVYVYFPVLCGAALVTGAVTGLVYYFVMPKLRAVPVFGS